MISKVLYVNRQEILSKKLKLLSIKLNILEAFRKDLLKF